jgi:Transglycosylase SLT domain
VCTAAISCKLRKPRALASYPRPTFDERADGKKAAANAYEGKVWLEQSVWDAIQDPRLRAVLLAHEYGHLDGAKCEDCADLQAGRLMGLWNIDGASAAELLNRLLEHRSGDQAEAQVLAGYHQTCTKAFDAATLGHILKGASSSRAKRKATLRVASVRLDDMAADAPAVAPTAASIGQELLANSPTASQVFVTQAHPEGETLAAIIADQALFFFPDDPRRHAWIMLAIVNHEAGRLAAGGYDPASVNHNTNGSTDYGLMQVNDAAHPDLVGPNWLTARTDARQNVAAGAQVLAAARASFPADVRSEINAYGYGAGAVQKGLAVGNAAMLSDGTLIPGPGTPLSDGTTSPGSDYASSELAWLNGLGVFPTDPGQWAPPGAGPVAIAKQGTQDLADAARAAWDSLTNSPPAPPTPLGFGSYSTPATLSPRAKRDAAWTAAFLVLAVVLVIAGWQAWEHTPSTPRLRAA